MRFARSTVAGTATKALVDLTGDEDPIIRSNVFRALVQRKDRASVPALRALEKDSPDATIKAAAKEAAEKIEAK